MSEKLNDSSSRVKAKIIDNTKEIIEAPSEWIIAQCLLINAILFVKSGLLYQPKSVIKRALAVSSKRKA